MIDPNLVLMTQGSFEVNIITYSLFNAEIDGSIGGKDKMEGLVDGTEDG